MNDQKIYDALNHFNQEFFVGTDPINNTDDYKDEAVIHVQKDGLIERIDKKFVTSEGKMLLRERVK